MSGTDIALPDNLPVAEYNATEVAKVSGGKEYLKQIRLSSGSSKLVKKGVIKPGMWHVPLGEDDCIEIGDSIDLLLLHFRPKAMSFADMDNIVEVYDPSHEKFAEIEELSKSDDQATKMANKFGITFFAFERTQGKAFELFCNSISMRIAADTLLGYTRMKKEGKMQQASPVSMGVRFIDKKGGYHVPTVNKCSEPIVIPEEAHGLITQQLQDFATAADRLGPEKVEKKEKTGGRKR